MKAMHASLLILFLATALTHGDEIIDSKVAAKMKTYTPAEFEDKANTLTNQIIRIKFSSRGGIRASKDKVGYHICEVRIWEYAPNRAKPREGRIAVLFPETALAWFTRIPTGGPYDLKNKSIVTVIGRVHAPSSDSDFYDAHFVELIGRNLKTDHKGTQAVW